MKKIVEILRKPGTLSVFILVALWNISVSSNLLTRAIEGGGGIRETAREVRDLNLHLQMRFYQLWTRLSPIPFRADHVSLAYIDDDTHWTTLYGNQPTSRSYLARLIRNASQTATKAEVIGLDFELLSPRHFPAGNDAPTRAEENQELLNAIQFAMKQGVRVVLPSVYYIDNENHRIELPNIYKSSDLTLPEDPNCVQSPCPTFGYIDIPDDKRQIPMMQEVLPSPQSPSAMPVNSFALLLAKAFRGPVATAQDPVLADTEGHDRELYGNFLAEDQYPTITVTNLANGETSAEQNCAGRIVIIGGRWHDLQGFGNLLDAHLSPAGRMSGMGLHANYVESLLQRKFTHELSVWWDIGIDIGVGLIIYICFEMATDRWWLKLAILAATLFIPFLLAWICLGMANLYLDFLLPIELYFLHILYEVVSKLPIFKTAEQH